MADGTIDRLEIQVQTQAQKANADLDKLVNKLERMSSSLNRLNTGGLKNLASGVDTLGRSVQNMSTVKTSDFTRLAKNIEKLGNINQAGINNTANALRQISSALTASTVSGKALKGLSDLANGISRLGYKSVSNAITNLPLLANSMRQFMQTLSTAPRVSANLIQMTNAMANLASQGSKFNSTIKSISSATNTLTTSQSAAYKSNINFMASLSKLTVGYYILRRAIRSIFEPIEKAMNIGETINLFQTSFKKIGMEAAQDAGMSWGSEAANAYAMNFIDEAQVFNDRITEALSLDPNTIMNYQAVFAQMSNAFGLTNESVMNLSNSFTMLGLDMASFFNTGVEEAMVKLRAGLAGETEPLRTLGIDITEATLKMTAFKYGIEGTVSEMSQAAKTQLRWLAIMDQADTVFGDMAKTIDSPANQLRILQQQFENLSRSIGTMFLPIITTILPYINAFFIVLRRIADTIAGAMGYELPDYTGSDIYQDVTGDIGGIGDSADDSTKSVNKLKKALAGFDELNILSEGSSKGVNIGSGGYPVLDDAIAKKTESYMEKFNNELVNMKNKAEELANKIEPKIKAFVQFINDLSPLLAGAAASLGALAIIKFFTGLGSKLAALANTPGLPVALAIGGIIAIYLAIKKYNQKLIDEDLASRFGEIELSLEEIRDIADELTTSKYTANIDVYISEKQKLSELQTSIETDLATIQKLNWKISIGMELTPEEIETYSATIDKFIADSNAYIEQQHYVTTLAVNAVIQDSDFNAEITELVDKYFDGSKGEMARLGKSLREEMDNALADGVLDANEQKVIDNLMREITEIQSRIADAEFTAKLQTLTLEGDLTADSYKKLFKEIQTQIDERYKSAEEAAVQLRTVVNAQYEIDMENATTMAQKNKIQKDYEEDLQEITDNLSQTKADISYEGITFATNVLADKWGTELSLVEYQLQGSLEGTLQNAITMGLIGIDPSTDMKNLVYGLYTNYETALVNSGMDKASRGALESMLKELKPTKEDNKKIYDEALKTGATVPQAIIDEFSSDMNLTALTGASDGIFYTIGQRMADSPEILTMLANGELSAASLDDSIILGLKSGIPDLKLTSDGLIFDVDKAIKKASITYRENMPGYAGKIIGKYTSAFDDDTTLEAAVKGWLQGINDTVNNWSVPQVKIPSPSLDKSTNFSDFGTNAGWRPDQYADGGFVPKKFATGGFPNTGEAFIARENGIPEMVGRIGRRTAVANNDQITDSVASAVESALMNVLVPALANLGGNVSVALEGDAKGLFKVVQKSGKEYYNMTGKAPFPV